MLSAYNDDMLTSDSNWILQIFVANISVTVIP